MISYLKKLESGVLLVVGHYGCGKTNLSVNMALDLSKKGKKVSLMDLDIVNPYFRASESMTLLNKQGIEVVAPNFAGTTLDNPSLPPDIDIAIKKSNTGKQITIIDVGGDPEGATALGRFSKSISEGNYRMLYVVNQRRLATSSSKEALDLLVEIEQTCRLFVTDICANTHLGLETTPDVVIDAIPFAKEVAKTSRKPLVFVTAPRKTATEVFESIEKSEGPKMFVDAEKFEDTKEFVGAEKFEGAKGSEGAKEFEGAEKFEGAKDICSNKKGYGFGEIPEIYPIDIYVKTPWM